jgi:hypothetical protein
MRKLAQAGPGATRQPASGKAVPVAARKSREGVPAPGTEDLLGRAQRLGHDVRRLMDRASPAVVQRMLFYGVDQQPYDPETFGLYDLQTKLRQWRQEKALPMGARTSGLGDPQIENRISQLELQIRVTTANGAPVKAQLDADFISKHLLDGNQVDAGALRASLQKSIYWNRGLNTVLHLSYGEVVALQTAAMQALRRAHFPGGGVLVPFDLNVGVATEYRDPGPELAGVLANFGIFRNPRVRLGVVWHPFFGLGVVTHLENIARWAPDVSYHYAEIGPRATLLRVYGDGPERVEL